MAQVAVVPRGEYVEFPLEAIEQSISDRFEQWVDRFSERIACPPRATWALVREPDTWCAGAPLDPRRADPCRSTARGLAAGP
jgi:hypothetical protein